MTGKSRFTASEHQRTRRRHTDERGGARDTDSGLPDDVDSLFQDDRGRIWVSTRSRGCLLREWPVYSRKRRARRTRVFHRRGRCGESSGSAISDQGLFHLRRGQCGRTDSLGQAGTQGLWLLLCSPILCRAVCGLDFSRVAWRISRTVRSAHRTAAADGLGEGRCQRPSTRSGRYALGRNRGRAEPGERTAALPR